MMFLKRKSNSNLKEAILKGVYIANLRDAGKAAEDGGPLKPQYWRGKRLWLVSLLLATVLSLSPGPGPSLCDNEESSLMTMFTAPVQPDDFSWPGTPWPLLLPDLVQEGALAAIPDPDLTEMSDHSLMGYTRLISTDDRVRLMSLFGLEVKNIVIDPGHGGIDPGALGGLGTKEKEITLDVALRLKKRLSRIGYTALLTRDSDRTMPLVKRVQFARENKTDLFISLHVNALPHQSVNVIETYYFGPPLTAETLRLAEQENSGSHYTVRELGAIIQDIGNTVKRQESARLAASIQKSLLRNAMPDGAEVPGAGIKSAPFVVLSQVEAPSVLVEMACLTNGEEEAKLASAEYREQVASYLEEGIVGYLGKQRSDISRWER